MSLTPAKDHVEAQRKKDAIELCGKNRGPHNYMPIEWSITRGDIEKKRVTRLLCKICFANITVRTLLENYPDVSVQSNSDNH